MRSDYLRVISGDRKGFRLKAPKSLNIRPTQDRVKESLFNILGQIDKDVIVLDLFAGSGSIGIEFLSRGAQNCYFIDNSIESIKTIKQNLKITDFTNKAFVYKQDVFIAIKIFGKKSLKFDYIYIDPPYSKKMEYAVLQKLCSTNVLKKNGIVIVEHSKKNILQDTIKYLNQIDDRTYGDKTLTFYKNISQ